jgi:hypothetical protein
MSDQPSGQQGAGSLPELTPEQETEVRRLLADARHDAPMPTEVADRLDTVLSGLTRDEPGSAGVAPVIDLAARRRRRNAAALLAGAAAVIVAGFVGGQVINVGSDDDGTSSASAGDAADRAGTADEAGAPGQGTGGQDLSGTPNPAAPEASTPVLQLRSGHLARDVRDQLLSYASTGTSPHALDADGAYVGCAAPPPASKFGLGELFPAIYDDTPAVLALRPPVGGARQADVLDCTTARVLASASIASR